MDTHSKEFFGQNTGLIISSSSKNDPYFFIRCIKKKLDGKWEKPSKGEGKTIKFSLEEAVMILEVLKRELKQWSTYHVYKDSKTQISFNWEDEAMKTLWININHYAKMLNFSQTEVMRLLVAHFLEEKIECATSSPFSNQSNTQEVTPQVPNKPRSTRKNQKAEKKDEQDQSEFTTMNAKIKGETEKALLLSFPDGTEFWVPKSKIQSTYIKDWETFQEFSIATWILNKNK